MDLFSENNQTYCPQCNSYFTNPEPQIRKIVKNKAKYLSVSTEYYEYYYDVFYYKCPYCDNKIDYQTLYTGEKFLGEQ